jgi:hypothetical protein
LARRLAGRICNSYRFTRRQLLLAALLWAGPEAAIDGLDACVYSGIKAIIPTEQVHIVVPWGHPARSRHYVVARRTKAPIRTVGGDPLRYVTPATAAMTVARSARTERRALAVLSDALQRKCATFDDMIQAHADATPRNARLIDDVLESLSTGVRSVPENDFRVLVLGSSILPPLLYNCLLRLPDDRRISPDALCLCCGVVHETNGRRAHAREDLFEDMQERHDAMTVGGLTVLHNSPRRVRSRGALVLKEFEQCHRRHIGRGLPPGVTLLRTAAE